MCRNCYITTFSALSPGTEFRPATSKSNICENYGASTNMSVPPELIAAKLDEQKSREAVAAARARNSAAALKSSAASTFSEDTAYSYDKDLADVTDKDKKKRSMSHRLKNAFK